MVFTSDFYSTKLLYNYTTISQSPYIIRTATKHRTSYSQLSQSITANNHLIHRRCHNVRCNLQELLKQADLCRRSISGSESFPHFMASQMKAVILVNILYLPYKPTQLQRWISTVISHFLCKSCDRHSSCHTVSYVIYFVNLVIGIAAVTQL